MKLLPLTLASLIGKPVEGLTADVRRLIPGRSHEPLIRTLRTVARQVDGRGREWLAWTWDPKTDGAVRLDCGFSAIQTADRYTAQIRVDLQGLASRLSHSRIDCNGV